MSFQLKSNERFYPNYIQNRTDGYIRAIKYIKQFFEDSGYGVKENVGCLRVKKKLGQRRINVVANVLARTIGEKEVASILFFPRMKNITTTTILARLERLHECFDQCAIFLVGSHPAFPYIVDRISKNFPEIIIFTLDLSSGMIRSVFRKEIKND